MLYKSITFALTLVLSSTASASPQQEQNQRAFDYANRVMEQVRVTSDAYLTDGTARICNSRPPLSLNNYVIAMKKMRGVIAADEERGFQFTNGFRAEMESIDESVNRTETYMQSARQNPELCDHATVRPILSFDRETVRQHQREIMLQEEADRQEYNRAHGS
jgi:hypothetical protein